MEKENDSNIISDSEFLSLLEEARKNDPDAVLQLVNLFKDDIQRVSKYINLPIEDAVSTIVLEFLEFIRREHQDVPLGEKDG